jgi:CheY-like chemotaxis protein
MSRLILLADDSITIQKVIELTFMDEDYQVVAVSNGDQAVAKLAESRPDIVIADVHMPGASGYDVCRRAKELYPGLPVLLLVGTFEPFEEADALAAGADGHLKKPFDSQELLRLVADLLQPEEVPSAAVAEAAPASQPAPPVEEESELERWDRLEIAEPGAVEEEAEAVWSNFEDEFQPLTEAPDALLESPPEAFPAGGARADDDGRMTLEAPASEVAWQGEMGQWGSAGGAAAAGPAAAESGGAVEPPAAEAWAGAAAPESLPPAPEVPMAAVAEPELPRAAEAPPAALAAEPVELPAEPVRGGISLSDADVERIARRVAELVGEQVVRDVAWEVIPDLAEVLITDRLRELEAQIERQVEN